MYDEILIPTDGSEGVLTALAHGVDLAGRYGARIHVLYVVDQRQFLGAQDDVQAELKETLHTEGETAIAAAEAEIPKAEIETTTTIRVGVPHTDILDYVGEAGIDMIVMGTHGRTGRDRLSHLGSVTERVVKGSTVPVLVVDIGST